MRPDLASVGLLERASRLRASRRAGIAIASAAALSAVAAKLALLRAARNPLTEAGISATDPPTRVPDFRFTSADGRTLKLSDVRGRALALNVWATWCVPCRREMPPLDRLQAALGGPDFQVVAISVDRQGAAQVRAFYADLGLRSLGFYLAPMSDVSATFGIQGIPVTLLIDEQGRQIGRRDGALEWDAPPVISALRHVLLPPHSAKPLHDFQQERDRT